MKKTMRTVISVMLAVMLILTCAAAAFAQTATNDEAATMKSIKIEKAPDKLTYYFPFEAFWDFGDGDEDENEDEEALKQLKLLFNIDLTGAVINAIYDDESVSPIDVSKCTVDVLDVPTQWDMYKAIEPYVKDLKDDEIPDDATLEAVMEAIEKLIVGEYTVEVSYGSFKDSYKINLAIAGDDYFESKNYEFVSFNNPPRTTYYESELYDDFTMDENFNEVPCKVLELDKKGMTVTLKNKTTGELETFGEDDFILTFEYSDTKVPLTTGEYTAEGAILLDDGYLSFEFPFTLVCEEKNNEDIVKPTQSQTDAVSTADEKKTTTTKTADNSIVKTGDVVPSIVLLTAAVLFAALAFIFVKSRKRMNG